MVWQLRDEPQEIIAASRVCEHEIPGSRGEIPVGQRGTVVVDRGLPVLGDHGAQYERRPALTLDIESVDGHSKSNAV
jgi:hypothetical protein